MMTIARCKGCEHLSIGMVVSKQYGIHDAYKCFFKSERGNALHNIDRCPKTKPKKRTKPKMSVLIKGMEMPQRCFDCPCSHINDWCGLYCMATLNEVPTDSRPQWCPLVEVEEAYFSHHPERNIYAKLP